MKRSLNIALLAALALSSTACEERREFDDPSSEGISFDITAMTAPIVKSFANEGIALREVMTSEGNVPIVAIGEVSDMEVSEQEVETRAIRYNYESEFASQTFKIWGWNTSNSNSVVYDNATVSKVGGKWVPVGNKKWKYDAVYSFVALYPDRTGINLNVTADPASANFTYTHQTNAGAAYDYMLAYFEGNGFDTKGKATLVFTHPFTCVKFAAGAGVTVNSVKLSGLYASGTCSVSKNESTSPGDYYTYSWNPSSAGHEITTTIGTELLLIPQNLATQNVTVVANITVDGISFNSTANLSTGSWLAGKVNTYTFTINEGVSVRVTDNVAGKVKNNVQILNTGASKAYIRAAIVAGWYDGDMMVAGWDEDSGTFAGKPGSKWVKVGDYYYYQDPVEPGEYTGSELFSSYTAPSVAPVSGAHLEMTILTQAVIWDEQKVRVRAAWGDSVISSLN